MSRVTLNPIASDESRIYDADGNHVGDVYAQDDILNPGARVYVVHLSEDPRGFVRVHDERAQAFSGDFGLIRSY